MLLRVRGSILGTEIQGNKQKSDNRIKKEELRGKILNKKIISLVGVNFSYIERGRSGNYRLDSFEIKSIDKNKMIGTFSDDQGERQDKIEFIRASELAE